MTSQFSEFYLMWIPTCHIETNLSSVLSCIKNLLHLSGTGDIYVLYGAAIKRHPLKVLKLGEKFVVHLKIEAIQQKWRIKLIYLSRKHRKKI